MALAEQKFGVDPWPLGGRETPSASAKRSAEQKMAGGTKIGRIKIWSGPSAIRWQGPLVQVQKGQQNKKLRN